MADLSLLKAEVFHVVSCHPDGITFGDLAGVYQKTYGRNLGLRERGYSSLRQLLEDMKTLVTVESGQTQSLVRLCVASNRSSRGGGQNHVESRGGEEGQGAHQESSLPTDVVSLSNSGATSTSSPTTASEIKYLTPTFRMNLMPASSLQHPLDMLSHPEACAPSTLNPPDLSENLMETLPMPTPSRTCPDMPAHPLTFLQLKENIACLLCEHPEGMSFFRLRHAYAHKFQHRLPLNGFSSVQELLAHLQDVATMEGIGVQTLVLPAVGICSPPAVILDDFGFYISKPKMVEAPAVSSRPALKCPVQRDAENQHSPKTPVYTDEDLVQISEEPKMEPSAFLSSHFPCPSPHKFCRSKEPQISLHPSGAPPPASVPGASARPNFYLNQTRGLHNPNVFPPLHNTPVILPPFPFAPGIMQGLIHSASPVNALPQTFHQVHLLQSSPHVSFFCPPLPPSLSSIIDPPVYVSASSEFANSSANHPTAKVSPMGSINIHTGHPPLQTSAGFVTPGTAPGSRSSSNVSPRHYHQPPLVPYPEKPQNSSRIPEAHQKVSSCSKDYAKQATCYSSTRVAYTGKDSIMTSNQGSAVPSAPTPKALDPCQLSALKDPETKPGASSRAYFKPASSRMATTGTNSSFKACSRTYSDVVLSRTTVDGKIDPESRTKISSTSEESHWKMLNYPALGAPGHTSKDVRGSSKVYRNVYPSPEPNLSASPLDPGEWPALYPRVKLGAPKGSDGPQNQAELKHQCFSAEGSSFSPRLRSSPRTSSVPSHPARHLSPQDHGPNLAASSASSYGHIQTAYVNPMQRPSSNKERSSHSDLQDSNYDQLHEQKVYTLEDNSCIIL
ncbi:proline-rich protein 36-like [Latimeria chalumnae]|uniref:proline-rich protein 36-like n=1 Tax=Latimeria chalumnae TaxID=7897 RepID=UPI0003C120AB|nr:PREDICTED: proline-rich protein 36-like [Latimeria chalumnae]|eukprot:XP_006005706.1 PREDICTED: proline-rich protein 36-like [Latimeria chalumnae]